MSKLTAKQAAALKMIRKFGRTSDKAAYNQLVKKGLVREFCTTAERLNGNWHDRGATTLYYGILTADGEAA
jgi:hypothetical protein